MNKLSITLPSPYYGRFDCLFIFGCRWEKRDRKDYEGVLRAVNKTLIWSPFPSSSFFSTSARGDFLYYRLLFVPPSGKGLRGQHQRRARELCRLGCVILAFPGPSVLQGHPWSTVSADRKSSLRLSRRKEVEKRKQNTLFCGKQKCKKLTSLLC